MRPGRLDQSCGVGIAWPSQGWRALPKRKSAVARHPPWLSGFRGSLMSVCLGGSGSGDAPPPPQTSSHPQTVCKLERVPGRPALGWQPGAARESVPLAMGSVLGSGVGRSGRRGLRGPRFRSPPRLYNLSTAAFFFSF